MWEDSSGHGRNATVTGHVTRSIDASSGLAMISGSMSASVTFPVDGLGSRYTLFHRARYNGENKGRIFRSRYPRASCYWWSGFHWQRSGVAHHDGWMTPDTDVFGSGWVVSTDQSYLYRGNGALLGTGGGGRSPCDLGINTYSGEESDWAVTDVLLFSRELSLLEILEVEATFPSMPSANPTAAPSAGPSMVPSVAPSGPTQLPSAAPSGPTLSPTAGEAAGPSE